MNDQRPNESLHAYLTRRERELVHQITAIHGELAPRERELTEVRQAMAAVGLKPGNALTDLITAPEEGTVRYDYSTELASFLPAGAVSNATVNFSEHQTIKQLIIRALIDHFHEGATPAQLRTYIKDAYGREIERVSMGPQISRLRDDKLIESTDNGAWKTTRAGRWYGITAKP